MTGSVPRLLGAATVGAGVAAAGYIGLVTGACPLDLGVGRRVRPLGLQLVDMARWCGYLGAASRRRPGPARPSAAQILLLGVAVRVHQSSPSSAARSGRMAGCPARPGPPRRRRWRPPHDQVVASHPQAMVPSGRKGEAAEHLRLGQSEPLAEHLPNHDFRLRR